MTRYHSPTRLHSVDRTILLSGCGARLLQFFTAVRAVLFNIMIELARMFNARDPESGPSTARIVTGWKKVYAAHTTQQARHDRVEPCGCRGATEGAAPRARLVGQRTGDPCRRVRRHHQSGGAQQGQSIGAHPRKAASGIGSAAQRLAGGRRRSLRSRHRRFRAQGRRASALRSRQERHAKERCRRTAITTCR